MEEKFVLALSERAPQIAYGGDPRQFVDSVIADVTAKLAERADRESKLACKLALYLFNKGDQYHSNLEWNGTDWVEKIPAA